jgi:O-antigen ligase
VLHPLMPVVISKLEGGGRQLVIRLDHYFAVCGFSFDSRCVAMSSPGPVHANDWQLFGHFTHGRHRVHILRPRVGRFSNAAIAMSAGAHTAGGP